MIKNQPCRELLTWIDTGGFSKTKQANGCEKDNRIPCSSSRPHRFFRASLVSASTIECHYMSVRTAATNGSTFWAKNHNLTCTPVFNL